MADATGSGKGPNDTGLPLVSVIIPCFNQGRFLADAVGSVLRQSYRQREVIVIDDGSSDQTGDTAKAFGSAVRYFHRSTRGVAAARNRGIRESRGELLLFLDADDWVSPDYLEWQVNAATQFPEASVFLSDVAAIDNAPGVNHDSPVETVQIDYPDEPVVPLRKLILGSCPYVHSAVVRRSLIDQIGVFDETLRTSEDPDFWIRAALAGARFVRSGGGVAVYRRSAGSLTSRLVPLHRSRLKLVRKLQHDPDVAERGLAGLVEARLTAQRHELWQRVLSYHTSVTPTSLAKFSYRLGRFLWVDPGFALFLLQHRPWARVDPDIPSIGDA